MQGKAQATLQVKLVGFSEKTSRPGASVLRRPPSCPPSRLEPGENPTHSFPCRRYHCHSGAWVQDFTHLRFMGEGHYLAVELGNVNRHKDLARFHEAIALAIFYYNTERIHLAQRPGKFGTSVAEKGSLTASRAAYHSHVSGAAGQWWYSNGRVAGLYNSYAYVKYFTAAIRLRQYTCLVI